MAQQPLKSFDCPLIGVSSYNSILVTLFSTRSRVGQLDRNWGISRMWIRRLKSDQRPIFSGLRFFNEPEISDSEPTASGPSRRTFSQDFYVLKKSIDLSRVEPMNLDHRGWHMIIYVIINDVGDFASFGIITHNAVDLGTQISGIPVSTKITRAVMNKQKNDFTNKQIKLLWCIFNINTIGCGLPWQLSLASDKWTSPVRCRSDHKALAAKYWNVERYSIINFHFFVWHIDILCNYRVQYTYCN